MHIDSSSYVKQEEQVFIEKKERKFTRIHFERKVRMDFSNDSYDSCLVKDLSLTGMYVVGAYNEQVGEECLINLIQTGISTRLSLKAYAKIVRKNDEGIAIEFISMPFDSYMYLQTTLLYEAEEPIEIGLELPEDCPFKIKDQLSESLEKN